MVPKTFDMPQIMSFSDPIFALSGSFSPIDLHSEVGRDFFCNFQSFFDVSALFAPICLFFCGTWLLTSFQDVQWNNLCFSVPHSLLHPRHFCSSDQPTSYTLLHQTSFHDQLPRHMLVLFRPHHTCSPAPKLGSNPTILLLSAPHARAWLPTSLSWLVSSAPPLRPAVRPLHHHLLLKEQGCSDDVNNKRHRAQR